MAVLRRQRRPAIRRQRRLHYATLESRSEVTRRDAKLAVIDHAETALARDRGVVWGYGDRLEVPTFGHIPLEIVLYAPAKRRFDIAVSALAIVLFAPVFLLCALAVRLTSRGPVLFRQTRVGQGG